MDSNCYILIIKERTCQSGVPVTKEKVYTNISDIDTILLDNGYFLKISSSTTNTINLNFVNNAFGININFRLLDSTSAIFDLPIQNGTYRVGVYLKSKCCQTCEG